MKRRTERYNQFDYIGLEFKEYASFSQNSGGLLSDFEYAGLQRDLIRNPEAGDLIRGTGGARKIRVPLAGTGKRGGGRVVYYYEDKGTIHLLLIYRKSDQENPTPAEIHAVRLAVEFIKKGKNR